MIVAALILSAIINIFFIWYTYTMLKKLLFVSDNIGGFLDDLQEYSAHVESVYKMETYYGDEVIEHLLNHSRDLVKEITAYKEIYELTHEEQEEERKDD